RPPTSSTHFPYTTLFRSWLDNKHTVFGNVVEGQDVVDSVAQGDTMKSVEIIRVGEDAKKWNAVEAFRSFTGEREQRIAKMKAQRSEEHTSELQSRENLVC